MLYIAAAAATIENVPIFFWYCYTGVTCNSQDEAAVATVAHLLLLTLPTMPELPVPVIASTETTKTTTAIIRIRSRGSSERMALGAVAAGRQTLTVISVIALGHSDWLSINLVSASNCPGRRTVHQKTVHQRTVHQRTIHQIGLFVKRTVHQNLNCSSNFINNC